MPPSHNAYAGEIQRLVRGAERGGPSCGTSKGHKSGAAKKTLWAAARQTNLKRVGYLDTETNQSRNTKSSSMPYTRLQDGQHSVLRCIEILLKQQGNGRMRIAKDIGAKFARTKNVGDSASGALQKMEKRTSRRCNRPDIKCGYGSQWTGNKPLIKELVDIDPDNGRNGRTAPDGGGLRKESQTREDPHEEMGLPG
ncbi:hypothetical protein B0H13DRAFT_1901489 [Mycena leptocephala]|nr:hypothetical protein B0H13DRAFT_1901489 [Mycena leptocephala]